MKFTILLGVCAFLCFLSSSSAQDNSTTTPKFKHILVFVLENEEFWMSNLNSHLQELAKKGTLLTNYKAIINPSQPNYIAMLAGDTMGVDDDKNKDVEGRSVVDLFEEKSISWKAYMEDYPLDAGCFDGSSHGKYRRKHNPFVSFDNVRNNVSLCEHIVKSDQLWSDIEQETLPRFIFYTPNMDNNGHDTGLAHGATWAYKFVNSLLDYQVMRDETLIVLTYDEGLVVGENRVFTLLIGAQVPAGRMDNSKYNHYSLLRTIEENYGLGTLGRSDVNAKTFAYVDNPPGFILTVGGLVGIVIAGTAVIITLSAFSVIYIRRAWKRRKATKYGLLQGVL